MKLNIFDNDVACLLMSSEINLNLNILKSDDNKVFFEFKLDDKDYIKATELIERYEAGKVELNLKKYNYNRRNLLKNITKIKNAQ